MLTAGKTNIGWVCLDELVRERGPRQQAPRRLIFLSFNLLPTVSLGVSSIRGCGRATKREGCRWGGGQPFQALPSGEWLWPRRGQKHQWNRWNVLLWNCLQSLFCSDLKFYQCRSMSLISVWSFQSPIPLRFFRSCQLVSFQSAKCIWAKLVLLWQLFALCVNPDWLQASC